MMIMMPFMLGSCTHNDGDIGPLFGFWRLDSMTENDREVTLYNTSVLRYTFAFQSNVMYIQTLYPHNDSHRCYSSWVREGDTITFDFDNHDSANNDQYTPPAALGFDPSGVTVMNVSVLTSSSLVVGYTDDNGVKRVYYLSKTR